MQFERSFLGMKVTPLGSMPASPMHPSFLLVNNQPHITHYSYMKGLSFCPEGIILSQSIMPQLDKFTYFTQFFWSCLFLFLLSIFFHYFFPSFRYTSASLLLLSNKAQVTAGSFYYEMVHLFLFIG